MTIQEILEVHHEWDVDVDYAGGQDAVTCPCGWRELLHLNAGAQHRAHVAESIEKNTREREAAVIAGLAELLDEYQNSHDVAECAAPVEGETGRQACIDKWQSIIEEPAEWLRDQSKLHNERGFEYLRYVAYEAWYAGYESGCEDMENGGHATTNPYADEESRDGRE